MRALSEKYFPLIEKQLSSTLTVKEFCKVNGINYKTLYYWKKRYASRISKGFTPLSVVEDKAPGRITICYSDGTRLIFEDAITPSFIKAFLPGFSK